MRSRFFVLFLTSIAFLCFDNGTLFSYEAFQKRSNEIRKENVPENKAEEEAGRVIFSLGFSGASFGADPCRASAGDRSQSSNIQIKSAAELTGLPGKPTVNVGRTGQLSEGEETYPQEKGENVCIESRDSSGNKCVEATANQDGTITYENKSSKACDVQLGENKVLHMAPKSEVTITPPGEKTTGDKGLESIGNIWKETRRIFNDSPPPQPSKSRAGGVRGQCDPYGVTGGCTIDKGSAWVIPDWMNPIDKIREAEAKGWVEKLTVHRINPNPETAGYSGGPKPFKTYPGEATKSGYRKEEESKTQRGGTITNPSGEGGGLSTSGFDLCGRRLPTPQEMTAMKIDPSHIVDPVESTWTGRIEQVSQKRSLVWLKNMKTKDGGSVSVERTYTNGNISSIKYTFYDRSGKTVGTVNYDAKSRSIVGKRF